MHSEQKHFFSAAELLIVVKGKDTQAFTYPAIGRLDMRKYRLKSLIFTARRSVTEWIINIVVGSFDETFEPIISLTE